MAEIENIHCPICTQPIPSSWQNGLPPALATSVQRGAPNLFPDFPQRQLAELFGEDEEREKARLLSISLDHAGDWLNTPPLIALGLHLRPVEFVLVVKYRLGLPVFDQRGPCPACLQESDILGDHALCCGSGGERISRHNAQKGCHF